MNRYIKISSKKSLAVNWEVDRKWKLKSQKIEKKSLKKYCERILQFSTYFFKNYNFERYWTLNKFFESEYILPLLFVFFFSANLEKIEKPRKKFSKCLRFWKRLRILRPKWPGPKKIRPLLVTWVFWKVRISPIRMFY